MLRTTRFEDNVQSQLLVLEYHNCLEIHNTVLKTQLFKISFDYSNYRLPEKLLATYQNPIV